jgi:hypothetical protein
MGERGASRLTRPRGTTCRCCNQEELAQSGEIRKVNVLTVAVYGEFKDRSRWWYVAD